MGLICPMKMHGTMEVLSWLPPLGAEQWHRQKSCLTKRGAAALEPKSLGVAATLEAVFEIEDGGRVAAPSIVSRIVVGT